MKPHRYVTPAEASEALMVCRDIFERMERNGAFERTGGRPLPKGTVNCNELVRVVHIATLLIHQLYPEMADPKMIESFLIRSAAVREAGGTMS